MRWRSIEISFLTLDCHLWWNAKIQKSILSMKCQIYYNYEDESWPSGSQERRKDRLLCWSILHVPCSLAANLRAILVQGVFRHYVSLCSNKFLPEYLTLETDNNTSASGVKRLAGFRGIRCPVRARGCAREAEVAQRRPGPSRARAVPPRRDRLPQLTLKISPSGPYGRAGIRWREFWEFVAADPPHASGLQSLPKTNPKLKRYELVRKR